jgi:hypothetical protein
MSNSSIFRKVSLERLSSPEQLDELMHVTNPRAWLALLGLGLLLGAGLIWSFFAELPTTAPGEGVITSTGPAPAAVIYVTEKDSKRIKAGQEVHLACSCAQPSDDGLIVGTVRNVEIESSTGAQMTAVLGNDAVARSLAGTGKIVAVDVALTVNPDPTAKSGVRWTKDVAPDIALKRGMSVTGDITTARQRPISLIIPIDERGR